MQFPRALSLPELLKAKSAFLFGPRSSGKTVLYESQLKPNRVYDLLSSQTFRRLSQNPSLVFEECLGQGELIVIDEVQKLPEILDEVHRTIQKKKARFLLTGSSARKLKKSEANLLGGRASSLEMFPLTSSEIGNIDLLRFFRRGGIPRHYLCEENQLSSEMDDYVHLYLKEEILQEAVTRNLEGFSRFLEIMALHSGDELSIESFSSDCAVKGNTFRNYIEVLKDTLIGFEVPAFSQTKKRKAITRSKFFLFDVGLSNHLSGRIVTPHKNEVYGRSMEHFIAMELRSYLKYNKRKEALCYWRSTSQFEVDFLVGDTLAIEVKSTSSVSEHHLRGLRAIGEEKIFKSLICVADVPLERVVEDIKVMPWRIFLEKLWSGELLK